MSETLKNGAFQILKGSPIAVALLLMFWMGNSFWGDRMSEMIRQQTIINERMAQAIEKSSEAQKEIAYSQKELVKSIETLHTLLIDHLRNNR